MNKKVSLFAQRKKEFRSLTDGYRGWQAHAKWANTFKLRNKIKLKIIDIFWDRI